MSWYHMLGNTLWRLVEENETTLYIEGQIMLQRLPLLLVDKNVDLATRSCSSRDLAAHSCSFTLSQHQDEVQVIQETLTEIGDLEKEDKLWLLVMTI